MTQEHLAMASVPVQQWGLLYSEEEALRIGTIFQDLNKPFFAAEEGPKGEDAAFRDQEPSVSMENQRMGDALENTDSIPLERASLLRKIQQVSFVLDDLRLYLDTHPQEEEGLSLFKAAGDRRKTLMREYARQFYPLTADCMAEGCPADPGPSCFCWQKGPAPWEGGCV